MTVHNILQPDEIPFERFMEETEPKARVRNVVDYGDLLDEQLDGGKAKSGCFLPWTKTHGDIQLRAGELSIWAGVNGHGKSQMLGHVMLACMEQQAKCCIASFEMPIAKTLARMARQYAGCRPTVTTGRQFVQWARPTLWLYDQMGTVKPERLLAVLRYAQAVLNIEHFVVDNLMKCVRKEDDYNAQKDFVDDLTTIARDTGLHIHLVHHVRKGLDETKSSGKFDLRGAGAITDQADNVFIIWRNKAKEGQRQSGLPVDEEKPDVVLTCDKQRHGDWEGRVALWYDPGSVQYLNHRTADIRHYGGIL